LRPCKRSLTSDLQSDPHEIGLAWRRSGPIGILFSGIAMQIVGDINAAAAPAIEFGSAIEADAQRLIGRTATAREIKARWAFNEVLSDRFGGIYDTMLSPLLLTRIRQGCEFGEVAPEHWSSLVEGLNKARNAEFTAIVDAFGLNGYVCTAWSVEDLMNAKVLPAFGQGLAYREFLTMFPVSKASGAIDPRDPRFKAWETPVKRAPFVQTEPLIAINVGCDHMLIEGYTRSILWLRSAVKSLLMWVPA
jgi:hypothetical protein